MYKLIIFDFDGTLADSSDFMFEALNLTAKKFGFRQIERADIERLRGQDNRANMRELGVPMWKLPMIGIHMRGLGKKASPPPLFPGVADMLVRLQQAGCILAVATSNSEEKVRGALGLDLAARISFYESKAAMFGKAKKFTRLLRRAKISPQQAIAIGDEVRDIEAARDAGIACAAVSWGYASLALLRSRNPDMVFTNVTDIAPRVLGS